MQKFGYEEGDVCGRNGCDGIVAKHKVRGCTCFINPPCSACTEPRCYCPKCDWQEKDDETINGFIVSVDKKTGVYKSWERRPLDPTKIDWHNESHTHFSMIKRGVYPEGTTQEQVMEKVSGTFGGRFKSFGNGQFEFIAYTD